MADFTPWDATTHTVVELEDDWNNLLAHGLEKCAAFIVRKNGSYYEALKGYGATTSGNISYGGADDAGGIDGTVFEDVVEAAISGAAGKRVHIAAGSYSLLDEIDIAAAQSGTWITGEGYGTQITQGTADKHGFKVTTATNVRISNLLLNGTGSDAGSGIYALTTSTGLTVDHVVLTNWGYHGIYVASSNYPNIHDNYIYSNIRNGLNLDTVNYGRIKNNRILNNTRYGAWLQDSSYNILSGNMIISNDFANAASYDGVNINHSGATSNYNQVVNNTISNNDRYEINISTASCTGNRVAPNNFYGTDREGILSDSGASTKMLTVTVPFIAGGDVDGTAAWANFDPTTANPKGWTVDDAADFATALVQLPLTCQQIGKIKIWAVALGAPIGAGGQMHATINMNAGATNAAYTTEPVSLANFDGEEADYVANDVVSWFVDAADDADIGSMVGGMSLEVEVVYNAGADPDGATNAVFRNVEVEYV